MSAGHGGRVDADSGLFVLGGVVWAPADKQGWPIIPEKFLRLQRQPGENRAAHRARLKKERRS